MERPGRPLERAGIRLDAHLHTVTSSAAFASIRDTGLARAPAAAGERVVDLSAGTSFLTLLLAATVGQMLAVDIARAMLERLFVEAHRLGLSNVELMCANLTEVDLPDGSVDLVVSSYALHHLSDEHKRALVRRSRRRLQPGGRLVIADMMLGRGTSKRDREIVRRTTRRMVRKAAEVCGESPRTPPGSPCGVVVSGPPAPGSGSRRCKRRGPEVRFDPIVEEAGLVAGHVPAAPV